MVPPPSSPYIKAKQSVMGKLKTICVVGRVRQWFSRGKWWTRNEWENAWKSNSVASKASWRRGIDPVAVHGRSRVLRDMAAVRKMPENDDRTEKVSIVQAPPPRQRHSQLEFVLTKDRSLSAAGGRTALARVFCLKWQGKEVGSSKIKDGAWQIRCLAFDVRVLKSLWSAGSRSDRCRWFVDIFRRTGWLGSDSCLCFDLALDRCKNVCTIPKALLFLCFVIV